MAGVHAVFATSPNASWFLCTDGQLIQPIDLLHLLFPNQGRSKSTGNICFPPRHFSFPLLERVLPPASKFFTPDDFVDSLISLILLCSLITVGMVLVKAVWSTIDTRFSAITPPHKKWYVVANLSKAFFLAVITINTRFWVGIYNGFFNDYFQMTELKRTVMMYIATDLVALYMVPKLPLSTIFHHVVTTVIAIMASSINLSVSGWDGFLGVFKMAVIYGMFSCIPFLVNAYLALRVVYPRARLLSVLVHLALWTYVCCCVLNWSAHASWLIQLVASLKISIFPILYLLPVAVVINDDLTLIKWLVRRSSPMASVAGKED